MLFEMLLDELRQDIGNLQMMSSAIAQIDLLANFAHQARLRNWARPEFSPEIGVKIIAGRHPVVEALNKTAFTPNDTSLDFNHRMAIVTGPNMGVNLRLCVKLPSLAYWLIVDAMCLLKLLFWAL